MLYIDDAGLRTNVRRAYTEFQASFIEDHSKQKDTYENFNYIFLSHFNLQCLVLCGARWYLEFAFSTQLFRKGKNLVLLDGILRYVYTE